MDVSRDISSYFSRLMFQNKPLLPLLVFIAVCVAACGGKQPSEENKEPDSTKVEGAPFNRAASSDTTLFIAHKVKDYDLWKASFELADPVRKKHGIEALSVYRDRTDTNLVLVLTRVTHLQQAKDYITSEDLQASMQTAGVIGAMDLYWLENQLEYAKPITDSLLMFMTFNVVNYGRWETAFLDDYRNETGDRDFQVKKVLRGIDDPGEVCMLFAVNDPDYIEKKENNNAFRVKMLASGVVSYPLTYKLKEMPL